MWKCDSSVKINLRFRRNSAGRFGQLYAVRYANNRSVMANLWQALLAALISLNWSQHNICVFQLVRTMFVQPTTKNSGEIQQIAFFCCWKGRNVCLCIYNLIFCLYTGRRRKNLRQLCYFYSLTLYKCLKRIIDFLAWWLKFMSIRRRSTSLRSCTSGVSCVFMVQCLIKTANFTLRFLSVMPPIQIPTALKSRDFRLPPRNVVAAIALLGCFAAQVGSWWPSTKLRRVTSLKSDDLPRGCQIYRQSFLFLTTSLA
jgi:hypothetical protein